MNYTYLLRCADGTLYCGWTNRLRERVAAHNAGKGAKYTKGRRPVELAYYETYNTKEEAMRRETAIKALRKEEKEQLAREPLHELPEEPGRKAPSESPEEPGRKAPSEPPEEPGRKAPAELTGKPGTAPHGGPSKTAGVGFSIIISPAKKMRVCSDEMPWRERPIFTDEAEKLKEALRQYTEPELAKLFAANDSITHENYLRYRNMDLAKNLTPAVLAYVGIQYQYMAPQIFSSRQWEYVCRNLRILSGFYGILKAGDGVVPYRLEMQARLPMEDKKDLYEFWGDRLWLELKKEARPVLNLASREYSRAVERYIGPKDRLVTCVFGTETDSGVKVKATEAKMARGEMVRFLAEREASKLSTVKEFDRLGYRFSPERSRETEYVFLKKPQEAVEEKTPWEHAGGRRKRPVG